MPDLFKPVNGGKNTVQIAVSTASARVAIPVPYQGATLRVACYGGEVPVFFAFGDATVVADDTDMLTFPGVVEAFEAPTETLYLAAMASAAGAIISITCGEGE